MANFIENYQQQVDERAKLGVVPQPLNAEQTAQLVELLKNPPAEQAVFLLDLFTNRIPAGVDEALSLIHISEPTRHLLQSRMPSSA